MHYTNISIPLRVIDVANNHTNYSTNTIATTRCELLQYRDVTLTSDHNQAQPSRIHHKTNNDLNGKNNSIYLFLEAGKNKRKRKESKKEQTKITKQKVWTQQL